MSRAAQRFILAFALSAVAAASAVSLALAQAAPAHPAGALPAAGDNAAHRRVFVPADRPEDWPTDGERYLPVAREEFQRLVAAAAERGQLAASGGVQITTAHHAIAVTDDFALAGRSRFGVNLVDPSPRLLPLAPCNVAVGAVSWLGGEGAETPALVGAWASGAGGVSRYGVLVERSAELAAQWRARPQSAAAPALVYRLALPAAVTQTVEISAPSECDVSLTPGRLTERTAGDGTTRWAFQMAAAAEHRLEIRRPAVEAAPASSAPLAAVVESYGITPRGLEYEAELRIQQRDASIDEMKLTAPPALRIASVLVDRQAAAITADAPEAGTLVVPLPRTAAPITVTVRGVAEAQFDAPWRLPSIDAPEAFWTEGTSTLWIDPALELQSIAPRLSRLVNLVGVGGGEGGEAYRLEAWSRDANTELVVAKRTGLPRAEVAVVAEFADRELTGRCQARLSRLGGASLSVSAALAPQWSVESLETVPAEALAQWHVAGEGEQRRLHVQLRRSPAEGAPVRLIASARKSLQGGAPAARLGELEWIRFDGVQLESRFLLVKCRSGDKVQAEAPTLDGVQPIASLSALQRELLGDPQSGLLFAASRMDRDAAVRVVTTPVRFQGEAWIELAGAPSGFEHRAEIACRPSAGAVGEVIVAAARPLPAEARWSLAGGESPAVELIGLRPAAADSDAPSAPVRYRVQLPQPQSDPFRLQVAWRGEPAATETVNSLTLPGADAWQSWAILRGSPDEVRADGRNCSPAAAVPRLGDGRDSAPLACFRLGDDPTTPEAAAPTLTAIEPRGASTGVVACTLCEAETLQFADGNQSHQFTYHLKVAAASSAAVELPEGFVLLSARVGDQPVPRIAVSTEPARLEIALPSGPRETTLTLDVRGRRRELDAAERVSPPLPRTSFPVLSGRWRVSAPAPFVVEQETARHVQAGWRQRLFGPLAREGGPTASSGLGLGVARGATTHPAEPAARGDTIGALGVPYGWSSVVEEFVTASPQAVIRRVDDTRATWHVTWLLAAVAASWLWRRYPRQLAAAAGLLAIACLVLPVAWIAIPQAVFLGLLAGAIMREIVVRTRSTGAAVALRSPAVTLAALALSATFAGESLAAEAVAPPPGVLFPLDAAGQPAGPDVYVPASLLNDLLPSAPQRRYDGAASAVVGADYRLKLVADPQREEIVADRCELELRVRTFVRDAAVAVPLAEQETAEPSAPVVLDDVPVQVHRTAEGGVVTIPSPGEHRLRMSLPLRTISEGESSRVVIRAAPLPGARVEVDSPPGLEGLAIAGERLVAHATAGRTAARLGATDAIEISWSKRVRAVAAGVGVEQLTYLEVDPATARVDVRLRLTGELASLRTLDLAVSPQLKLMPLPDDAPVQVVQIVPGSPTIVQLKFKAPPQSPVAMSASFEVQRSVSLGRIDFPSVRVVSGETTRHHFAAAVDRRLRVREDAAAGMTPAPVAEIERLWGSLPAPPALQYAVAPGETTWSLNVEPTPPRFTAREGVEVACAAREAEVRYSAAIDVAEGALLGYRVAVPAELRVEDVHVSVDAEQGAAAVRWSRPRPDLVCVFVSRPLSEPHALHLAGSLPYAAGGRLAVPLIGLESTRTTATALSIRRRSDVVVSWSGGAEPPPSAGAGADAVVGELLVGRYSLSRTAPDAYVLDIAENQPRVSADLLLTVDLQASEPQAALLVRGKATRGVVDRIRLLADGNWRGPHVAEPAAAVTAGPSPQEAGRQVIEASLSKPAAAGEEFSVRITGPLALEADQRVRFPNVKLLDADQQRTFLALPRSPAHQSAEWTIRGLARQSLPAELVDAAGGAPGAAVYQAQRDRFLAEQRVFPEALRTASVRLAETRVALDADRRWTAVTRLIVQPGAGAVLSVQPPSGVTLLYATIDEQALVRPELKSGAWNVPAGQRYLPRVITVAYRAAPSEEPGRYAFEIPGVAIDGRAAPIARSLWQVDGETGLRVASGDGGRVITRRAFQSTVRQENIAAVNDASVLAFQLPEWELHEWFRPWRERLAGSAPTAEGAAPNEATWRSLEARVATLTRGTGGDAIQGSPEGRLRAESAWFEGPSDGRLSLAAPASNLQAARWALAAAIAAALAAAWRRPDMAAKLVGAASRWPGVVGALAGLLWWALLSPPLLGPAIIVFSIAGLLKNWQAARLARPLPPPDANAIPVAG